MSPEAMVAPGSPFYDVLRQAAELGYTRLVASAALEAMELQPVSQIPVALASGNPEMIQEFAAPFYACGDGSIRGRRTITETRS